MEFLQKLLQAGAASIINVPVVLGIGVTRYDNDFVLKDKTACKRCKLLHPNQPPALNCNESTMNVQPWNPMAVFDLDAWIRLFPHKTRHNLPNCDYIFADAENLYASRRIAFCDLSCLNSKYAVPGVSTEYPQGKRLYMLKQMTSMATWLMQNELLRHYIATATHRSYIFGLRFNDIPLKDEAASAMHSFSLTPSSTSPTITSVQTLNYIDFDLVEINYPAPLRW